MLFDNLSPKTDFSSKIQLKLDIISGNVLYLTHEVDKVKKMVDDIFLRIQVNKFYQSKIVDETSPQTDTDELGTN